MIAIAAIPFIGSVQLQSGVVLAFVGRAGVVVGYSVGTRRLKYTRNAGAAQWLFGYSGVGGIYFI